ncbi:GNAT family N-acetyltransferase [Shewanella livingstonensis]|uniref:N-acetyltransferase n=1 Tax=Shewanella livingstonensis TaxID=150120 RepID=A0A3G8LTT5_9GAMM|nr:GNAT family N-acetyltransferase [Shewanella livingstonensis]AZG72979.1 N-acetyltransferase [Shewanella livingstonensis]
MKQVKSQGYQYKFVNSINTIDCSIWNEIFGVSHPFTRHEYLSALEMSGCVSTETGWTPMHLVVLDIDNIIALMPLYLKTHSWGEYVFDWAWAEAYERNDIEYYPKLVGSIPFTPTTGRRVGFSTALAITEQQSVIESIQHFLSQTVIEQNWSSWHCLFTDTVQQQQFSQAGVMQRVGCQFHWHNQAYTDFNDFLATLTSRKRKNILKERTLARHALQFRFVDGDKASNEQWQSFVRCYQSTYLKRSGHAGYLSPAFFEQIAATMGASIRLLIIEDTVGELVASALYLVSDTHLFGRYWGALTECDGLHFEACYYQGIEFAIANQLSVFDAGAQGEHKVMRGFLPVKTYSNHFIAHEGFNSAISHFCQQEQAHIDIYMQQMCQQLPYKSIEAQS